MKYDYTYISFGGGVQSTAMLVMSALGLHGVPRANIAIFADTMHELPETYQHVAWMKDWASHHGIEVDTVCLGDLWKGATEGGVHRKKKNSLTTLPLYLLSPEGKRGFLHRQCTVEYKVKVIRREVRRRLGFKKGQRIKGKVNAAALIGISIDEALRAKQSDEAWVANVHPLVDAGIDRADCERILREHRIPVPIKSSCYFCPFHSDRYWSWLKAVHPEWFNKAVQFERDLQKVNVDRLRGRPFLTSKRIPLDQIGFETDPLDAVAVDNFGNDCEGHCGV